MALHILKHRNSVNQRLVRFQVVLAKQVDSVLKHKQKVQAVGIGFTNRATTLHMASRK